MWTMKYYSALKRKEILAQATAWMKLEGTELREGSSMKDKFCMIPLT